MLAVLCQTGDTAERDTCCETLAHCQYPSVYLAAKMALVRKNKCSLQRPLKMDAGINRSYDFGGCFVFLYVCLFVFPKLSDHFTPQVERSPL